MYKKNIIWLASYPKSGNTWFRVFLTNLMASSGIPAQINHLVETSISSSRKIFDDYAGLSSSDLTYEEIDRLRPEVYRMQSMESNELLFKKVHDKFYKVNDKQLLFPPEISKGVVYIIRNPLDVLVSFAYHRSTQVNNMIPILNDPNFSICDNKYKLHGQLRQFIGSWSDHVKSWSEQTMIPVHIIRYEDMVNSAFTCFSQVVTFIGLEKTECQIKDAIQKSDFVVLSKQEKENGFREKMINSKSFFRKGTIGDWQNHLDKENIKNVITNHKDVMLKYGYLDSNNELLF